MKQNIPGHIRHTPYQHMSNKGLVIRNIQSEEFNVTISTSLFSSLYARSNHISNTTQQVEFLPTDGDRCICDRQLLSAFLFLFNIHVNKKLKIK